MTLDLRSEVSFYSILAVFRDTGVGFSILARFTMITVQANFNMPCRLLERPESSKGGKR